MYYNITDKFRCTMATSRMYYTLAQSDVPYTSDVLYDIRWCTIGTSDVLYTSRWNYNTSDVLYTSNVPMNRQVIVLDDTSDNVLYT